MNIKLQWCFCLCVKTQGTATCPLPCLSKPLPYLFKNMFERPWAFLFFGVGFVLLFLVGLLVGLLVGWLVGHRHRVPARGTLQGRGRITTKHTTLASSASLGTHTWGPTSQSRE